MCNVNSIKLSTPLPLSSPDHFSIIHLFFVFLRTTIFLIPFHYCHVPHFWLHRATVFRKKNKMSALSMLLAQNQKVDGPSLGPNKICFIFSHFPFYFFPNSVFSVLIFGNPVFFLLFFLPFTLIILPKKMFE